MCVHRLLFTKGEVTELKGIFTSVMGKGKVMVSYATGVGLLCVCVVALAGATVVEEYMGSVAARALVYYSPFFWGLLLLVVVNYVGLVVRYRLLRKRYWGVAVIYLSLAVMLSGAILTHVFGREGTLHLREGDRSDSIVVDGSGERSVERLPFVVELRRFTLTRYAGSGSPSWYESELLIDMDGQRREGRVEMNRALEVRGWRIYQASYDRDEKGAFFSVHQDVVGRRVTYIGYCLASIGFVLFFIGKDSRFRWLNRQLKALRRSVGMVAAFVLAVASVSADEGAFAAHAVRFGALPMQGYNGRIMPVSTFASDVLRKLHQSERIGKLNAEQFLLSLLATPERWLDVSLIALPNNALDEYFDLTADYCSYHRLFDSNGNYKLSEALEEIYVKPPAAHTRFDKDLLKLDERANIFHQLIHGQLLNIFPLKDAPDGKWVSAGDDVSAVGGEAMKIVGLWKAYLHDVQVGMNEGKWETADQSLEWLRTYQAQNATYAIDSKRLAAERLYNRLNVFGVCKTAYLVLGGLLLTLVVVTLFVPRQRKLIEDLLRLLWAATLTIFLFHLTGVILRGFIGGHAPWSNSYETMVCVAGAAVGAGLLFYRSSVSAFALAVLFGGIILFVSGLNRLDPQIGLLVPVLKSPWLMFHVAVIIAAYGFFGIGCLAGIVHLIMRFVRSGLTSPFALRLRELSLVNEVSLCAGLALMTCGTFLGAVWANAAWGRYWGWDPKETWALITILVYAIVLQLRLVDKHYRPWLFNLASVVAFLSVLMTWFGVNTFMGGMHSYDG